MGLLVVFKLLPLCTHRFPVSGADACIQEKPGGDKYEASGGFNSQRPIGVYLNLHLAYRCVFCGPLECTGMSHQRHLLPRD